ncbi:MAG: hypothetical protein ACI90Y_002501, partial [Polaromonas sp.]
MAKPALRDRRATDVAEANEKYARQQNARLLNVQLLVKILE